MELELREYLALLRKWAWLLVLCALLAAVPAYLLTTRQPQRYQATATLYINQASSASTQDYTSLIVGERLAQTYAQLMTAQPVLQEVATRLDQEQVGDVSVKPVENTQLLMLRVVDTDPTRARDVANTLPVVFSEQNEELQLQRYSSSKASLLKELEATDTDINVTQASLDALKAAPTPDASEISRLESELVQYRTTYANLLRSYEDIRVAEARTLDTVTVVEPAVIKPVAHKTQVNTLLAAIVGAMVAAGVAFLVEYLDDTVKSAKDVERASGLPTFGVIVRYPRTGEGGPLTALEPRSALAEGYRLVRTNLQFATMGIGKSAVVLLVTSAQPGEGKTNNLANLGVSLAQAGRKVLLVDADLRRPALHRLFNLSREVGLTSLLLEREADVEHVIQKTGIDGLRVLPSGPVPANPAEVLGFAEMGALFERLRTMADFVLLDSPPVLSVADTSVLAQKVDGVLMVVEAGGTRTQMFERAVAALQAVKARVLGTILTKVDARRGATSYEYYYYYSGYYEDEHGARHGSPRTSANPLQRLGRAILMPFRRKPQTHAPRTTTPVAPTAASTAIGETGTPSRGVGETSQEEASAAVSQAEGAPSGGPAGADALYVDAMEHYHNHEYRQAREALLRLKALDPARPNLEATLQDVESLMKRSRAAQRAARQAEGAARRGPKISVWQALLLALLLLAVTGGVLMYSGILPVPNLSALFIGNQVQIYINRGYDFFIVDKYEESIQSFNRALQLDPDNTDAKLGLQHATQYLELRDLYEQARALMAQKSFDAAIVKLESIIQTDPWYKDANLLLSQAQGSQDLEVLYQQAMGYYNAGDWERAASVFEGLQGKGVAAGEAEISSKLFDCYLNAGRKQIAAADSRSAIIRATQSFNSALALSPNDLVAQEERQLASLYLDGYTAYERADWRQAIANLSRISTTRVDYAQGQAARLLCESYMKLGDSYLANGQPQLAVDQYRLVQSLQQCDPTAALGKIQQALALSPASTSTPLAKP